MTESEESSQESFKPTKDGMGWICGEDIDVSVDEGNKKAADVQEEEEEEEVPLEVQLGKGEAADHFQFTCISFVTTVKPVMYLAIFKIISTSVSLPLITSFSFKTCLLRSE